MIRTNTFSKTYSKNKHINFCRLLSTLRPIRSQLQKIEFALLWIILAYAVIFEESSVISVLYTKVSFLTRVFAYSVDIANAMMNCNLRSYPCNRGNGKNSSTFTVPLWLVLHHFGFLGMHALSIFYIPPKTPIEIIAWTLTSQSSHNTWMKKRSMALYWGDVLIGMLAASINACFLYDIGAGHLATLFVANIMIACTGILLLVRGGVCGSQFFLTVKMNATIRKSTSG